MTNVAEIISSAAKLEQNRKLHGSQVAEKPKDYDKVPEKEAENGEGTGISALTFVSPLAYKVIIHLQEKRVTYDMIKNLDSNLRVTRGIYMIKYLSKKDKKRKKGRPWCIGQDIIRMGINVGGPRHFNYLCEKIPELNWLRHNTTYCDELFDIAAMHPGIPFWFSVDWLGYAKKLAAQPGPAFGSKQGSDSVPYAVYKCSADQYRKHYQDKCATLRVLGDVLKEVQEVEMLPSVQKEMLEATGETGITREQYIKGGGGNHQPQDPATGRFVKKQSKEE